MLVEEANTNAHRLEYLYLNLVGQVVQVHTVDGAISEGIFVSRTDPETPENEAGIFVSCSRFLRSNIHEPLDAMQFSLDTKLFRYQDILLVEAPRVKLRTEIPGMGHVHSYRGEHSLKAVNWAEEGQAELLEGDNTTGDWDQFKANERLGVVSTYSEDKYTTKLDHNKITKEQHEYATRMAKEIESSPARGVQHRAERGELVGDEIDDSQLFSDVARDKAKKAYGSPSAAAGPRKGGETKGMSNNNNNNNNAAAAAAAVNNNNNNSNNAAAARRPGQAAETMSAAQAGAAAAAAAAAMGNAAPQGSSGLAMGSAAVAGGGTGKTGDFNPNPAAAPFVPARAIINDYLKTIADAIFNNPECYETTSEWPGEDHHYDKDNSSYSQQQGPKQGAYMPPQPPQQHPQQPSFMPTAMPGPQGMPPGVPQQPPHMSPQAAYGVNGGNPMLGPASFGRAMGHQVMNHPHHHHMHHSMPFAGGPTHGAGLGGSGANNNGSNNGNNNAVMNSNNNTAELAHYQMPQEMAPAVVNPAAHHLTHHPQYMEPPGPAPSGMMAGPNVAVPPMAAGAMGGNGTLMGSPGPNGGSGSHGGNTPLPGPSPPPPRMNQGRMSKGSQPQQPVSVSTGIPSMVSSPPPPPPQSQMGQNAALRPQTSSPSQPQQQAPSSSSLSSQQPQNVMRTPTPQPMAAVPTVDSGAEKAAAQPAKRLRRGGISAAARNESAETAPQSKKGK